MAEHLSEEQRQRYQERRMLPTELLAADAHLSGCPACRDLLREEEQLQSVFASLRQELQDEARGEPDHPSYERLAAFVDGRLEAPEREMVESHLTVCAHCAAVTVDLGDLQETLRSPATPPVSPAVGESPRPRALPPVLRAFLWAALAAAGGLLFAGLLILPRQRQIDGLRAEVSRLRQTNTALESEVSRAADAQRRLAAVQKETQEVRRRYEASRATVAELRARVAALKTAPPVLAPAAPPRAVLVLALRDANGRVTLDRQGRLGGLDLLPPELRQRIAAALRQEQVRAPQALVALLGKPDRLMGPSEGGVRFALEAPVGTVVRAARPTFRWQALSGAESYTVAVTDADGKLVAQSEPLSGTAWQVPRPLRRGGVYEWQVTALKDGQEVLSPVPPAPDAKFQVLGQEELKRLEHLERVSRGSHLALGILYAGAGLLDDAEGELQALARENTGSLVARRLLQSIRELRRQR